MIHVFHGFLGSPEDFSFLNKDGVVLHDLYTMESLPDVSEEDTLIGYSMGGRVSLEVASQNNFRLKKIILINAHPGLSAEEQKKERAVFESVVLEKFETTTREEFLRWWNSLSIFNTDAPIAVSSERFQKSKALFQKYALSKQKDYLPEVIKHKDKVLWIIGLEDEKYMSLTSDLLLPHDILIKAIPGGHRSFQRPSELLDILTSEGIL